MRSNKNYKKCEKHPKSILETIIKFEAWGTEDARRTVDKPSFLQDFSVADVIY